MLQSVSAATDLDLIGFRKAIPNIRMRRGIRIPAWYLLLVAVLGFLSKCESLRDLERFARRHHTSHRDAGHPGDAVLGSAGPGHRSRLLATNRGNEHSELKKLHGELDLEGVLIQADALHTQKAFFDSSQSRGLTSC